MDDTDRVNSGLSKLHLLNLKSEIITLCTKEVHKHIPFP